MSLVGTRTLFRKRSFFFIVKMMVQSSLPLPLAHISLVLCKMLYKILELLNYWQIFLMSSPFQYINRFHFRGGKLASSEVSCSQQRPCHNRHDQLIHFSESKLSSPKVPSYLEYSNRSTSTTVTKTATYVFDSSGYLIFMKVQTEHLNKNNLNIALISTFIPWNAIESLKTQWLSELLLFYLQPGIITEFSSNRSTSKILDIKFFSRRIQNIATEIYQRIRSRMTL